MKCCFSYFPNSRNISIRKEKAGQRPCHVRMPGSVVVKFDCAIRLNKKWLVTLTEHVVQEFMAGHDMPDKYVLVNF
jgi:hypothetical protein